jgi:hypothetical protein
MYKEVLQSIEGIERYPVISLVIFFLFFVVLLYLVLRSDKGWLHHMAQLPLDDPELSKENQELEDPIHG